MFDDEEEREEEAIGSEVAAPKVIKYPGQPTRKERDEHEVCHVPYRSWGRHCVRGRAIGRPRRRVQGQEVPDMPRASIDYWFFPRRGFVQSKDITEEERDDPNLSPTILVMQEASTHLIWAYPVSKKGVEDEEWVASRITADLNSAGLQHCKIVFKSDQELSVVEVQHDVMRKRTEQGLSTSLHNSPVGDSDNNGRVERAIRDLGGTPNACGHRPCRNSGASDVFCRCANQI